MVIEASREKLRAKNGALYSTRVNRTDTFIFSLTYTSFARIISPFEMYLLTFFGSYAKRYMVVWYYTRAWGVRTLYITFDDQ